MSEEGELSSQDGYRQELAERLSLAISRMKHKEKVATAAGITGEQLNKWVKGDVRVSAEGLRAIATFTNVDFSWLVTGQGTIDGGVSRPLHGAFDHLGAQADGRDRSRPSGPDVHRLTVAIEAVEDGLSGRQLPASVKAELILVAYELLTEATPENRARIMRLVKGA